MFGAVLVAATVTAAAAGRLSEPHWDSHVTSAQVCHVAFERALTCHGADKPTARRLARVLLALKEVPEGTYNCPADRGDGIRVTFALNRGQRVLTANLGGCAWVTGAGNAKELTQAVRDELILLATSE